jgi:tetratricopeptide (TPR) repeat protein
MNPCTNKSIGEWIGLYEFGALDDPELNLFKGHIIECEYCFDQVFSLEVFGTAFRTHREVERRARPVRHAERAGSSRLRWVLDSLWLRPAPAAAGALLLLTIAILTTVYVGGWRPGKKSASTGDLAVGTARAPFDDLQIVKAAYKPPRAGVILRTPRRDFDRAMAAYLSDDLPRAIQILRAVSDLDPDGASEAKFYLGVSLLVVGRSEDAILPLKQASNLQDEIERENTLYYLALAYLKTNQPQQALPELEAVVQANGAHREDAQRLIQRIAEVSH